LIVAFGRIGTCVAMICVWYVDRDGSINSGAKVGRSTDPVPLPP
jgi:hypothetical protein